LPTIFCDPNGIGLQSFGSSKSCLPQKRHQFRPVLSFQEGCVVCHESEAGNPDRGRCDHEFDLLFSDEIRQTVRQTKKTAGSGKRFVPFGRSFRRTRRRAGDEHLSPQDKPLEFQDILSADADRSGCSSRIYHREVDCLIATVSTRRARHNARLFFYGHIC